MFWWNTGIYLCGTSETIASLSAANWINAPSGCCAGSRAENCIFCYAALLMVGSTLHSPGVPSPSLSILKPLLENLHIQQKNWACWWLFLSTNSPLVSLRALTLVVLCRSMNCWGDYHAPMQNTDPTWNSSQCLEIFASGVFTQVISPYRASNTAPFSCQTPHRASHLVKKS